MRHGAFIARAEMILGADLGLKWMGGSLTGGGVAAEGGPNSFQVPAEDLHTVNVLYATSVRICGN